MMKTEIKELASVSLNEANPRTITEAKFQKLINSLLSLPRMLEIRPIVIDAAGKTLGGNMRLRALNAIAQMGGDEVNNRLAKSRDVQKKSTKEREALKKYWTDWLLKPTVTVIKADNLTKAEQKEFIIKDNGDFGSWDFDVLANNWDADDLGDWGVDVWKVKEVEDVYNTQFPSGAGGEGAEGDSTAAGITTENLPPELQGIDLNPANLPKIEGSDETAMERIIIVYPKERASEVAQLVGLGSIDKVVYSIDELLGEKEGE